MFGLTNIGKDSDKGKYVHNSYGITFDGKGKWRFDNGYARNVIIFGVDNSSSSHIDNLKNYFLILGEGDTFGTNESFDAPVKNSYQF